MAERKRRIVKTTPMPEINISTRTEGVAIKTELIRVKPSSDSLYIGALVSGDKVDILDSSLYSEGWIKIKSRTTTVEGYVSSKSIL